MGTALGIASTVPYALPAGADLRLSDQESAIYYRYALVAGHEVKVDKDSEVIGNLHANDKVKLKHASSVVGDVSAVNDIWVDGAVSGIVLEGVEALDLPGELAGSVLRDFADRILVDDVILENTRIDDILLVDGSVLIRGSLAGVGTLIATGEIYLDKVETGGSDSDSDSGADSDSGGDSDSEDSDSGGDSDSEDSDSDDSGNNGDPMGGLELDPNSRLSLMALDDIRLGKDRPFRGVLRAGRDVKLEQGAHLQGVAIADRKVHLQKSATVTFLDLDTEAPELIDLTPEDGSIQLGSRPEVVAIFAENFSGLRIDSLELIHDGVDFASEASIEGSAIRWTPASALAEGQHTLEIALRDHAENETRKSLAFAIDTLAPSVILASPMDGAFFNEATIQVMGTVSDSSPIVEITVNGQVADRVGDQFTANVALSPGSQSIVAMATDRAGRQGFAIATITLDQEPPTLSIETPSSGQVTNAATLRFAGVAEDDFGLASVEIAGTQVDEADGTFDQEITLPEGVTTVVVEASDLAGNVAQVPIEVQRLTVPSLTLEAPADWSVVNADAVDVVGAVSEGAAVQVNGIAATVMGESFLATAIPLIDGRNVLNVVATAVGGQQATARTLVFRDGSPPRIAINDPGDGAVMRQPRVSVQGLVNDISSGLADQGPMRVTVNGQSAQVANRQFLLGELVLEPGENEVTATAIDPAGNVAQTTIRLSFDPPEAPTIRIDSGNLQSGQVLTELAEPLVVRLTDSAGEPLADRPVFFEVTGNDGHFEGGQRQLVATSDANGRAAVAWTLGARAGAGTQRVEATASGLLGRAVFFARATPGSPSRLHVDSGDQQVGAAGQALPNPLVAVVTDASFNRLAGVAVSFQVVKGGGLLANGLTETMVTSDAEGQVVVRLRLDAEEGIANHVVEARLADVADAGFVTFVASGRASGDSAETSISGLVLDNTDLPVADVSVHVAGTSLVASTDAQGRFQIPGAPVGSLILEVDGRTTSRPGVWPHLEFDLNAIPGRDNSLGRPIYLLPIDVDRGLAVSETVGGTLILPDYPGFALEIAPGSVTFPNGGRQGVVSATRVHNDRVPMVPNFGQQPRFVLTIQPSGAKFDPPARLTLPNVDGLAPGAVTEMYSFDHDLGSFVSIGPGTVSNDGRQIESNPGVGVIEAGWHCGGNPATAGTPHDCPSCTICDGSRCVVGCPTSPLLQELASPEALPFKNSCNCDDGDECTVNDQCTGSGCEGDPVKILSVSATVNNQRNAEVPTQEEVTFSATAEQENCSQVDYDWIIEPLGPEGEQFEHSGSSFTHSFSTPGPYRVNVTARCGDCSSETDTLGLIVYAIEIQLEPVGRTEISTDGLYSEDTTIRATARRSDTGAQLFDFQGAVELEEVGATNIYQQNGGSLPASVILSFSGTTTFVAKSLADAQGSSPPDDALITVTNYPIVGGQPLKIEQWVDVQEIDPARATGGIFDWLETRVKDIFASAGGSGPLFGVLSTIVSYSMADLGPQVGAQVVASHAADHTMLINPFFEGARLDGPVSLPCVNTTVSKSLTNVIFHEARHGWQDFLTTIDFQAVDDLPGSPNNDDDQDFLVDKMEPCPCIFVVDSPAPRQVCNQFNNTVFEATFQGDATSDLEGPLGHSFFAHEMDAHQFATSVAP